jgi:hypothetical protein
MKKRLEYFDCGKELDMIKAENILANKTIEKSQIVEFPYLMLIWED